MMNFNSKSLMAISASVFLTIALVSNFVEAKSPRYKAQAVEESKQLLQVVQAGDDLWHSPKLGSNGLACGNCHPDGSATNPHTFPKFQSNLGKVGSLREMINWCITVPMQGSPLAHDSKDMLAMEAYVFYTHRGVTIAPGKDEQHGAVPVKNGPGYPVP